MATKNTFREKLKSKQARGGFSLMGYAISLAVSFFVAGHTYPACGAIVLAILFNVYLFWPEIKLLKIAYPRGSTVESLTWLYIFGFVALVMVVLVSLCCTDQLPTNQHC